MPARVGQGRRLAVLGATGSVGENALAVARRHREKLRVTLLAASGSKPARLAELVREFRPARVVVATAAAAERLAPLLPPGARLLFGEDALVDAVGADKGLVEVVAAQDLFGVLALEGFEVGIPGAAGH